MGHYTKKYTDMLGAAVTNAAPKPTAMVLSGATKDQLKYHVLPALVGAGAGYWAGKKYWKGHKWLGMLSGAALAGEAKELWSGDRKRAMANLVPTAAGVGLSLTWRRHPALGFVAGAFGASLVVGVVRGS